MRTILIDPFAMTVTEHHLESLNGDGIAAMIGVDNIDRSPCGGSVSVYVDDVGLKQRGQRFWHFVGSPVLMGGKGVLVSLDERGEIATLPPYASLSFTQNIVAFLGDANGAERAIQKGIVMRPRTEVITFDGTDSRGEVIWQWDHNECLAEAREGGAA